MLAGMPDGDMEVTAIGLGHQRGDRRQPRLVAADRDGIAVVVGEQCHHRPRRAGFSRISDQRREPAGAARGVGHARNQRVVPRQRWVGEVVGVDDDIIAGSHRRAPIGRRLDVDDPVAVGEDIVGGRAEPRPRLGAARALSESGASLELGRDRRARAFHPAVLREAGRRVRQRSDARADSRVLPGDPPAGGRPTGVSAEPRHARILVRCRSRPNESGWAPASPASTS